MPVADLAGLREAVVRILLHLDAIGPGEPIELRYTILERADDDAKSRYSARTRPSNGELWAWNVLTVITELTMS